MRNIKQWLATAAVLLCGATGLYGQSINFILAEGDGPLGELVRNGDNDVLQYELTCDVTLDEPSNVVYFTFLEGYTETQYLLDRHGYPFVALAEFQIYDADGKEIKLEAHNFSTNAQESTEGPIADICDGDRSTYFHSTWSSGASGCHYLRVELPDTLSAFSFKYYTRNSRQCIPKQIAITTFECRYPFYEEYPIELTANDGLLSTASVNEKNNMFQYEYTSSTLTLEEPSNVLYFTFLEEYSGPQYAVNRTIHQYPFVALSEFCLYDANGKEIKLDARNFSTNAPEKTEGPIADICDGNRSTYFHTSWTSSTSDYHYLRVALPDTLSAFSFKYYTRDWGRFAPKKIGIKGEYCEDPYVYEDPYEQVLAQGTCGENVSWTLKYGGHLIISGEGDMEMPGQLSSPWEDMVVAKVTIENGVTSISDHAFRFCHSLAFVSIPASVTKIGRDYSHAQENPFAYCYNLRAIEVDKNNPVFDSRDNCNAIIKTESNALVAGCYTTRIPETVVSIEGNAFEGCRNLTELYIPKNVTSIAQGAFKWPFQYCNLNRIIVEEGNPVYDSRNNCNAVIRTQDSTIVLGSSNTTFPVGVTRIGEGAFSGCRMDDIVIPEGITSVGDWAFGTTGLKTISIPASVTEIGEYAFGGVLPLVSIVVDEANEVYDSRNNCNAIIETATNTLMKGCSSTIIPDGIERIGRYAFYGAKMKSVIIPEGVVEIGSNAFTSCNRLVSVTIPQSMNKIGDVAFNACNNLETITIPENVEEIGHSAFFGCKNLASATISKGVKKIGSQAFCYCGMSSLTVPKSVKEIGTGAFRDCRELTEVTLPKRFKGREKDIFENCDKLEKIRYRGR